MGKTVKDKLNDFKQDIGVAISKIFEAGLNLFDDLDLDDESMIIAAYKKKYPEMTIDTIKKETESNIVKLTQFPNQIYDQYPAFFKNVATYTNDRLAHDKTTIEMNQVWFGDYYDHPRFDGLNAMLGHFKEIMIELSPRRYIESI